MTEIEDYFKCANCDHDKSEHDQLGHCSGCDCTHWELDSAHLEEED